MKIRIKGNSVRYRLSKTDVANFMANSYIEEHTSFGVSELIYALQQTPDTTELTATFDDGKIIMYAPCRLVEGWAENDTVGFEAYMPLPGGDTLYLLLEKDFQCIDQTNEDQSDNYVNPNHEC
ncbi:DUF7009 family protein [Chitinophagaceae bacterium MMS25-I14]